MNVVSSGISDHFRRYRRFYIIFGALCLIGLIFGLVSGFRHSSGAELDNIPDATFVKFIQRDINILSLFFSRLFSFLAIMLILWICNCKRFLMPLCAILLAYRAFVLGASCAVIMSLFGVGGVLTVFIVMLPCHLTILFALVGWSAICAKFNHESRYTGMSVFSGGFFCCARACITVFLIMLLAALILEAIFLPWVSATIVITVT